MNIPSLSERTIREDVAMSDIHTSAGLQVGTCMLYTGSLGPQCCASLSLHATCHVDRMGLKRVFEVVAVDLVQIKTNLLRDIEFTQSG